MQDTKQDVLHFWFVESQPAQWFQQNNDFDKLIADRFGTIVRMARQGVCDGWAEHCDGALALCIVLDQFPRNLYRNAPDAFASDEKAIRVATQAINNGYDRIVDPLRRRFFYLPFSHSEDLEHQERAVTLFAGMRDDDPVAYEYALRHRDIIARFGRFPHRNAVLGRESTPDELVYLSQPGAGF
jgi:uncharacterized protein (DUF924 family)